MRQRRGAGQEDTPSAPAWPDGPADRHQPGLQPGSERHRRTGENRTRNRQGGAGPDERPADHVLPAGPQSPGEHGSCPSSPADGEHGLDVYIKRLVDAAPPLTAGQRDTLSLLLRRPRRR